MLVRASSRPGEHEHAHRAGARRPGRARRFRRRGVDGARTQRARLVYQPVSPPWAGSSKRSARGSTRASRRWCCATPAAHGTLHHQRVGAWPAAARRAVIQRAVLRVVPVSRPAARLGLHGRPAVRRNARARTISTGSTCSRSTCATSSARTCVANVASNARFREPRARRAISTRPSARRSRRAAAPAGGSRAARGVRRSMPNARCCGHRRPARRRHRDRRRGRPRDQAQPHRRAADRAAGRAVRARSGSTHRARSTNAGAEGAAGRARAFPCGALARIEATTLSRPAARCR